MWIGANAIVFSELITTCAESGEGRDGGREGELAFKMQEILSRVSGLLMQIQGHF